MKSPGSQYITDKKVLEDLCCRLRDQRRFALDTEFVGEDSFVPRLELIQVAAGGICAVIDFPAVGSLDGLADLLGDPGIEKVVHAGRQDLELFYLQMGRAPGPIFDTQLAAAMVGYGTQIAYAQLVQRVLGTKLEKSHTLSNWSHRPLTMEQLTYALEDVRFLLPVYEHLQQRLAALGRSDWAQEEFRRMESRLGDAATDARQRYQRIRGWEGLKPRLAAVLRALVEWRDREARERNVPRGRVVRDDVLLELARRAPTSPDALRHTRGLHGGEVDRNGAAILAAIKEALALPEDQWPEVPRASRPQPETAGLVELLQAVIKALALDAAVAPTLLATANDLQLLVEAKENRDQLNLPLLQGWRRQLAGEALLQVLDGQTAVLVDRRTKRLRFRSEPSGRD